VQLSRGDFITENGLKAKILKLVQIEKIWAWRGFIWDRRHQAWVMTGWTPEGRNLHHNSLSIFEKAGE
jgi:hypothetical protein